MSHNAQLKLRKHNCPSDLKRQAHELLHLLTYLGLNEEQQVVFWDAFPGNEQMGRSFWREFLGFWHEGKSERPALLVFLKDHWDSVDPARTSDEREPSRSSYRWLRWFERLSSRVPILQTRATTPR